MDEDAILEAAVHWLEKQGWQTIYRTRSIAEGAIGGVDAILAKEHPWQFAFVDAKGDSDSKERRSVGFTNCLGAMIKRIRFESGYRSNEQAALFRPLGDLSSAECRDRVRELAVRSRSHYILALPQSLRRTALSAIDPSLAALLNLQVLIVSEAAVEEMAW